MDKLVWAGSHQYQIRKAEIAQDEYHVLILTGFNALVTLANDPKKLSFPYIGNKIIATSDPKLLEIGYKKLVWKDRGCIGGGYEMIPTEQPDKVYAGDHRI